MKYLIKLLSLTSIIFIYSCISQNEKCDDCRGTAEVFVKFIIENDQDDCLFGCGDSFYKPGQLSIYSIDAKGNKVFEEIGSPGYLFVDLKISLSDTFYFEFDSHVDLLVIEKKYLPSNCPECPVGEITAMTFNDNLVCIDSCPREEIYQFISNK